MILVGLATQNKGFCRDCKWRDRIYRELVYKMESDQGGGMGAKGEQPKWKIGERLECYKSDGEKKKVGAMRRRRRKGESWTEFWREGELQKE